MKYCFIINPKAGKGAFVEDLEKNIKFVCEEANVQYDIFTSKAIGDTKNYIKWFLFGKTVNNLKSPYYGYKLYGIDLKKSRITYHIALLLKQNSASNLRRTEGS